MELRGREWKCGSSASSSAGDEDAVLPAGSAVAGPAGDSGSGWPSFFDVIEKQNIRKRQDASGGEVTFLIASVRVAMTCNSAQ